MAGVNDWEDVPIETKDEGVDDWEDVSTAPKEASFFEEGGQFEAGARAVAQGVTLGFSDEIIAGLRSAFGDKTFDEEMDSERSKLSKSAEDFPVTTVVGELAGGVVTGGALLKGATSVVKGAKLLEKGKKAVGVISKVSKGTAGGIVKDLGKDFVLDQAIETVTGIPGLGSLAAGRRLLKGGKINKKTFDKAVDWAKKHLTKKQVSNVAKKQVSKVAKKQVSKVAKKQVSKGASEAEDFLSQLSARDMIGMKKHAQLLREGKINTKTFEAIKRQTQAELGF